MPSLFSAGDFIPHGHCYLWRPTLVWLHLLSDSVIALSYYTIPLLLLSFARQRPDIPFRQVFWLFGAFIIACGSIHLMDVWTLWHPTYWVAGGLKATTGLISIITAVTLFRLLPHALAMPSTAQLAAANERLQQEIAQHKRTEADLRQRKAGLREAQRLARLGNWEFDMATQSRRWSEELYRLFGLDPQAPLPSVEAMWQRFTAASRAQLQQAIARATTDGIGFELEVEYIQADGSLGWLQAQGQALRDEAGQVTKLVGNLQEITPRKQAAQQLQALSQRLTLALRSGAIGTWDWDLTTNSLTWDERMYELYGLTPDQFSNVYEGWAHSLHPDDRAATEAAIQQALRGEQDYNPEFRVIHPDGSVRYLKAHALIQRHAQGEPQHMIGINYDITERKQAEQQLELHAIIIRNMAEGVCLVRVADERIVYANPKFEALFGYAVGELAGQPVSVVNYGDDTTYPAAVHQSIAATILEHGEATYEVRNVTKAGQPLWCQATTALFEHPDYGPVLVAVQQDITARKAAEQTIRASLSEKEVLLQEIHHRVKNNLQIVYSLLRLQWRQLKDKQAAAALWESQNRIAAIALVHEKLYRAGDLAHINAREYITSLVSNLVGTYSLIVNQVELQLEIDPLALDVDQAVPCGLIINELVSNVLKYAFPNQEPGLLTVQLYATAMAPAAARASGLCACPAIECGHQLVTLVVADNGVGLPDTVPVGEAANTLGLQLVADFTAQLKGTLQIGSQQINGQHGTHIRVMFPAHVKG